MRVSNCHNCGATLSKTSIEAFVPSCDHCGTPIMDIGGTLGITSAFEKDDPTLRRELLEKQLDTYREYSKRYDGMIEVCKEQLNWGGERYAHLPEQPELLKLKPFPPFWEGWGFGLIAFPLCLVGVLFALQIIIEVSKFIYEIITLGGKLSELRLIPYILGIALCAWIVCLLVVAFRHLSVKIANGDMPKENARRQRAYDNALAAALKEAEPVKNAEDHRLRRKIVDLEGKAKVTSRKEQELRNLLAKFGRE
jgi:hypothetical protein